MMKQKTRKGKKKSDSLRLEGSSESLSGTKLDLQLEEL